MAFHSIASSASFFRRLVQRRARYDFKRKVVVITGGSRGLGLEIARAFAQEGAHVAICARTSADVARAVEHIRAAGAGDVIGSVADVRARLDVERFIDEAVYRWGHIDVLVNNAGVIQVGPVEHAAHVDYREAMNTHFWGPLNTIEAALPFMRERESGRIVNVCSIAGKIAVPHLLPYSASKFALAGLSEGLRAELAKSGIFVTTVFPGLMRTGSPIRAMFKGRHREEYAWFAISDSLPLLSMSSSRAAKKIREACRRGRAELVLSIPAKLGVIVSALLPELTAALLSRANLFLPKPGGVGREAKSGRESESVWTRSFLTTLSRESAVRNNE